MAEHTEPDRLDVVLASVGRHLVVDPRGQRDTGAADTVERVEVGDWPRRVLVAAAVVLVVAVGVASIAPARRVVSGWLRAGNIEIEVDPDVTVSPGLPDFVDDAAPLQQDDLAAELGRRVPAVSVSSLGAPDAWWAPREGGIVATWTDHETSLWIVATVDTFPASLDKWLRNPEAATSVPDLGQGGYVVEGSHIFQTPFRTVAANSVVAWSDDDLTFRLDSTMPADQLIDIARSIAGD